MWHNYFDRIFLINLDKRIDRLEQATAQLTKYHVPFERVSAVEMLDGAEGLRQTMLQIFQQAVDNNWQRILIFEDDLDIVEPTFTEVLNAAIPGQVPDNWDIIYLGCQLNTMPRGFYWENMLCVNTAQATHAAAYSLSCIKEILKLNFGPENTPIDNWLTQTIQRQKRCYCIYPFLVSQIVSKSDIYTADPFIDWKPHLEVKFQKQMDRMKEKGIFIRKPKTPFK